VVGHLAHRVDQLAAQQIKRRLAVDLGVVERIGEDFGRPNQPGLHVFQEKQLHGAKDQCARADEQPEFTHVTQELHAVARRREQA